MGNRGYKNINKRKIALMGIGILVIVLMYLFLWGLLSHLRSSSLVFSCGFGPPSWSF